MNIKRRFIYFLVVITACSSLIFQIKESKAIIPLVFYIGLVTSAYLQIGAYCEVNSCVSPPSTPTVSNTLPLNATLTSGDSWVGAVSAADPANSANSFLIGDNAVRYQIPMQADKPIPTPVPAPTVGDGSDSNPIKMDEPTIRYSLKTPNSIQISASSSLDGAVHYFPSSVMTFQQLKAAWILHVSNLKVVGVDPETGETVVMPANGVVSYINNSGQIYTHSNCTLKDGKKFDPPFLYANAADPDIEVYKYNKMCDSFDVTRNEEKDNVKRFKRVETTFKPDETDPDWTPEEITNIQASNAIQINSDDGHKITNATIEANKTKISSAVQVGTSVRYRVIEVFNGVPVAASDSVLENSNPGSVLPASGTSGTGSGSSTGPTGSTSDPLNVKFPDDYSRQGTAAATQANTQSIANSLKDTTDASEPTVAPTSDFANSFFNKTFDNLLEWTPPQHVSTCPTPSFNALGQTFTIDAHCALMEDNKGPLQTAMSVIYLIMALFIVLKA